MRQTECVRCDEMFNPEDCYNLDDCQILRDKDIAICGRCVREERIMHGADKPECPECGHTLLTTHEKAMPCDAQVSFCNFGDCMVTTFDYEASFDFFADEQLPKTYVCEVCTKVFNENEPDSQVDYINWSSRCPQHT